MTRDPLLPRVLYRGRDSLPCPTCEHGAVFDYDRWGRPGMRRCMVCGGRGTVGTGYALTSAREET